MRNKMNKEQRKRKSHMELEKSSPLLSSSSAAFLLVGEGMKRKKSHIQCHFDSDLLFKNYYFSILNKREPSALHNHINDLPLSKCSLLDQQRAIGSRKYCTLLPRRFNPSRLHSSTYRKRNLERPKALGNGLIRPPLLLEAILLELYSVKIIKTKRKIKVKSRRGEVRWELTFIFLGEGTQ